MKIFLIRHGQSMQNTKENYQIGLPDHKVYLTEQGKLEAEDAAKFLLQYIEDNNMEADVTITGSLCENKCDVGPRIVVNGKEYTNVTVDMIPDIMRTWTECAGRGDEPRPKAR